MGQVSVYVCMLRRRWRRLMLQKTQTFEGRGELSSSVSWNFKASGVASKTFYSNGVGLFCWWCLWFICSVLFYVEEGHKPRGKWKGKPLLVLPLSELLSTDSSQPGQQFHVTKRIRGDTCWRRYLQTWSQGSWEKKGVIIWLNWGSSGKWAEVQL